MAEYFSSTVKEFLEQNQDSVQAKLHTSYANDGFSSQYTTATKAWTETLQYLHDVLKNLIFINPGAGEWGLVLEYPLYRLRIRLDVVILSLDSIFVIELKTESKEYLGQDKRQVEEYALDLRDFHSGSTSHTIIPILWCPKKNDENDIYEINVVDGVSSVICVGRSNLVRVLDNINLKSHENKKKLNLDTWLSSGYKPVPSIITAATAIFSNHGVREISNYDSDNLLVACEELIKLVAEAKHKKEHYLLLLTGVPGSGKTLAGLNVVHESLDKAVVDTGQIVYLSGNTPLVTVLREALAIDQVKQSKVKIPPLKLTLKNARSNMRVTIQHVMDFLNQYLNKETLSPPIDRVVIFDEAQRAWDKAQGKAKFQRDASEPELIISIMNRHKDWAVIIALVGVGQEINDGENGLIGWGDALSSLNREGGRGWKIFGNQLTLNTMDLSKDYPKSNIFINEKLYLSVPQRSYRAPNLSKWVDSVINGDPISAKILKKTLARYPLFITRDISTMKSWLISKARGQRRIGLLASSGAKRLRADGFGEFLTADGGVSIAHWYLQPIGDIRSSYALEVPSNEYTSQGLEIDFVGLCWGGDLIRSISSSQKWVARKLNGNNWNCVKSPTTQKYIENSYRVLMTRAREGMIIWVPKGDNLDKTRQPLELDLVYSYLLDCGVEII